MTDGHDQVTATFRSEDKETKTMFQDLRNHLKDQTNNKKTGKNACLNMCVRKAWRRLQHQEGIKESVETDQYISIHGEDR